MAMTIMNNTGAEIAISAFNQNVKQADKSLVKLSSGQKFKNANEDTSGYSMSERMIEKIRALFQDDQNIQNGSSMVKTAERGIAQIVDNLRTMKALAIDAANDSNTDEDRRTIQKEMDQRREVINDIALGTKYNGKILLDGRWTIRESSGNSTKGFVDDTGAFNNGVKNMFNLSKTTMTKSSTMAWANGKAAYVSSANNYVPLDFSASSFPDDMDQQGFSILCTSSSCPSFYGFKFDSSMESGTSSVTGTASAPIYVIGIKGADTAQKISEALFNGVANAVGQTGSDTVTLTSNHTSESVIRDADMAKEITDYTKYNILARSSQAVLVQANQNGSFVLGMFEWGKDNSK